MYVKFMCFFAAHAWTGTHRTGEFGDKITSTYCLVRVDNAGIIVSVRHVNYLQNGTGKGMEAR